LCGRRLDVPACDNSGQYLGGGWLEEYVFTLLRDLEERGLIHDLRIGMQVDYTGRNHHAKEPPRGEFDYAFIDGKRLWLVECKAGNVKQEDVQKLENRVKTFGGHCCKRDSRLIVPHCPRTCEANPSFNCDLCCRPRRRSEDGFTLTHDCVMIIVTSGAEDTNPPIVS